MSKTDIHNTKTVLRISQAQYEALQLLSPIELLMFQRTFDSLVELCTIEYMVAKSQQEEDEHE